MDRIKNSKKIEEMFGGSEISCTFALANKQGAIAQLVEQRTENPCVPGSIPGGTTCKNSQIVLKQRFGSFSFVLNPKFGYILTTF